MSDDEDYARNPVGFLGWLRTVGASTIVFIIHAITPGN